MGVQFQVDVNVTTHGAEKVNELEQKLNSLQSKGADIKINVEGLDKINTSNINRQMQNAGKQASQNFNKSFVSNIGSKKTKINNVVNFAKLQQQANKEVKNLSNGIQNGLGIDEKEADKIAKQYINVSKKSVSVARREQRKLQAQQVRQAQQDAKNNLAQQLSNVERLNKNKADIIVARANGKSATVEALREERKQIRAEQKQLQKDARKISKASGYSIPGFSSQERAKAIEAKQLATKSLVDKAWASVNDKNSEVVTKRFDSELSKAKKSLQSSLNKYDYADADKIKESQKLIASMGNMKASDYEKPLEKIAQITKQTQDLGRSLQNTHKVNLDGINKEIKAEEQNIAQTRKAEQSRNQSQVQQKISQLGYENRLKNAHNQEIMNRIQQTRQKYESQQPQLAKIQQRDTSGEFEARNAKADKFLSRYKGQDSEVLTKARKYASELKSLQSELQSCVYSSGDKKGLKIIPDDQVRLMNQINEKAKQLQNSFTEISNLESKTLGAGVATKSANNVASYMENNTRALKKYGSALTEIQQQYRSATTEMEKSNIDKSFAVLKSRISAEGLSGNSWIGELKRATGQIAQFAGVYGMLQNTVMQLPYKTISAVKDYDSAMTNMQMATGISNTQAQELMNTYSDMGKQLKVTGVDVATSATEWMKQGKTIEESNKLAQDSIVLSKIGDLSSDDATRTITAAMKSYDLNESQVMDFVDQISAIDMASATDVGGLANAFNEVAANANQAGISTKQLLSYAAVIGETTQEGMSSVGTSLNAIFSRMGNIKLSRLKDYQNGGEDLSNVETVLRGVGISLRDTDGEFRNFGDVLDDTAARWSDFGTVQQRAVAQAFSGTNHMNDFMVLMQQYSKAQEYMQIADDASGTSMEKYGAYTDSLEGKLEGLESTFESLSNTVVNSDFLKGTIDTGTQALEIFDKVTNSLGVINTAAIGLGIFQGKNNSGESTWDSPHAFFKTIYAA